MSARSTGAGGAPVRRPPIRTGFARYQAPSLFAEPTHVLAIRPTPPPVHRDQPVAQPPRLTSALTLKIGRIAYAVEVLADGLGEHPRCLALRAADGVNCRVTEAPDGTLCDCAGFSPAEGCPHYIALVAWGLIDREIGWGTRP